MTLTERRQKIQAAHKAHRAKNPSAREWRLITDIISLQNDRGDTLIEALNEEGFSDEEIVAAAYRGLLTLHRQDLDLGEGWPKEIQVLGGSFHRVEVAA